MALITCPECQRDISEQARLCPNCGFRLKPSGQDRLKAFACRWKGATKQQRTMGAVAAAVLLLVLGLISPYGKTLFLTPQEKYAVIAAKAVQDGLLNPQSMELLEVIVYIRPQEEISQEDKEDGLYSVAFVGLSYKAQTTGGGLRDDVEFVDISRNKGKTDPSLLSDMQSNAESRSEMDAAIMEAWGRGLRQTVLEQGEEMDVSKLMRAL